MEFPILNILNEFFCLKSKIRRKKDTQYMANDPNIYYFFNSEITIYVEEIYRTEKTNKIKTKESYHYSMGGSRFQT